MTCEKAGEVTAKTRFKFLQLGAIFVRTRKYVDTYCIRLSNYRSGGARKVQLKVLFLILKYYLGFATCTDSYVDVFFCPSCRDNS